MPLSTVLSVLSLTLAVGLFLSGCGGGDSIGQEGRIYAYNQSAMSVEDSRIPGSNLYVLATSQEQTASTGTVEIKEGQPGAPGAAAILQWFNVGGRLVAPLGTVGPIRTTPLTYIASERDGHGVYLLIGRE
jgi:hypothetical protein